MVRSSVPWLMNKNSHHHCSRPSKLLLMWNILHYWGFQSIRYHQLIFLSTLIEARHIWGHTSVAIRTLQCFYVFCCSENSGPPLGFSMVIARLGFSAVSQLGQRLLGQYFTFGPEIFGTKTFGPEAFRQKTSGPKTFGPHLVWKFRLGQRRLGLGPSISAPKVQ